MQKTIVAAALLATWSVVAVHAQTGVDTMLPVPPLPPIGLPLPHIGLPPPEQTNGRRPEPVQPGRRGNRRNQQGRAATVLVVPYIVEREVAPAVTRETVEGPRERPAPEALPERPPQPPEPVAPPAPPAPPAPRVGPVYIITGCYAGNVPPSQVRLPAGCDASKATTLER